MLAVALKSAVSFREAGYDQSDRQSAWSFVDNWHADLPRVRLLAAARLDLTHARDDLICQEPSLDDSPTSWILSCLVTYVFQDWKL